MSSNEETFRALGQISQDFAELKSLKCFSCKMWKILMLKWAYMSTCGAQVLKLLKWASWDYPIVGDFAQMWVETWSSGGHANFCFLKLHTMWGLGGGKLWQLQRSKLITLPHQIYETQMNCHSTTAEFQEFFFFLNGQMLQERSAASLAGKVRHFSLSHPNGLWNLGSAIVGRLENQKANIQSYSPTTFLTEW